MDDRTFVVRKRDETKTFAGFNRDYSPSRLDHVVLITVDGEIDVWAVDGPESVPALVEFLAREEQGSVRMLGTYSRH